MSEKIKAVLSEGRLITIHDGMTVLVGKRSEKETLRSSPVVSIHFCKDGSAVVRTKSNSLYEVKEWVL